MSIKCFYHKADLDGECSGAIVKYYHKETELFPFDYGEEFPWDKIAPEDEIFMIDVSLPRNDMIKLKDSVKNLIYIDHHISKINELKGVFFNGIQRDGVAACILTWNYFITDDTDSLKIPEAIKLLGYYDVWKIDDNVLDFQYGARSLDTNPENQDLWSVLFVNNKFVYSIKETGRYIRKYQDKIDKKNILDFAFKTKFRDYSVLALNKTTGSSLIFKDHPDYKNVDILMVFGWIGNKWKISLYTLKDDIDVSIICKEFGGGGHKQAAGFKLDILTDSWEKCIFGGKI